MKQNITVLLLILLTFLLPLATSLLLDLHFIQAETSRKIVVYTLMLTEAITVLLVLINYLKSLR